MRFTHELSYDAPPSEVFKMLADPAFREKVCSAQDVVSAQVAVDRTEEGFVFTNDQVQRTEGLPSFARKFAGDTTRAIQVEEWADSAAGSLRIEVPGKPSSIDGTIALVPNGAGTSQVFELEARVKVPLIGGKLEALLEEQVRRGLDVEHEVGQAWLRGEK
jgi:hypothetical protein